MKLLVRAPSNIAIVKYMGKSDAKTNLPAHGSLSMTLGDLCTQVHVDDFLSSDHDSPYLHQFRACPSWLWRRAENSQDIFTDSAIQKMERHLERVQNWLPGFAKKYSWNVIDASRALPKQFSTMNEFPADSGIASSASGFAAWTVAFIAASLQEPEEFVQKLMNAEPMFLAEIADISRQGSGSSCRSFLGPWVKWNGPEDASSSAVAMPISRVAPAARVDGSQWLDLVVLVSASRKSVSSSEAHMRVLSSPLWTGRTERANQRLQDAMRFLSTGEWGGLAHLSFEEALDMHSLFHTAADPWSYWLPGSMALVQFWFDQRKNFPEILFTMDAGANVHFLLPESQERQLRASLKTIGDWPILSSRAGQGVSAQWIQ